MERSTGTKASIANAALDVLSEAGLKGATFDRIAERAGCAKGLVNYHFPSRIDLFAEVVSLATQRLWAPRQQALSASGSAVVDQTWKVLLAERGTGIQLAISGLSSLRSESRIDQAFKLTKGSGLEAWRSCVADWLRQSRFRTDSQDDVSIAIAAILQGFAATLADEEPDDVYPAYLIAWLGLTAALAPGRS
jgi:AcrR family transcriptional regulator